MTVGPSRKYWHRVFINGAVLFIALCFCFTAYGRSSDKELRLIKAGLDLFSAVLTADLDITGKLGADDRLLLVLVYSGDKQTAQDLSVRLNRIDTIRGIPIQVRLSIATDLKKLDPDVPAGIFLTERLADRSRQSIIHYGVKHKVLVFSPFEDDVRKGVAAGISVTDRILPYINIHTVHSSEIRFKPFFLKIAKQYE